MRSSSDWTRDFTRAFTFATARRGRAVIRLRAFAARRRTMPFCLGAEAFASGAFVGAGFDAGFGAGLVAGPFGAPFVRFPLPPFFARTADGARSFTIDGRVFRVAGSCSCSCRCLRCFFLP